MNAQLTFHDYKPDTLSLQDAVLRGLSAQNKSISPKYFYDRRGSELFDRICEQPEYYPPTVEQEMLITHAGEIARLAGTGRIVVEPGAGSASKIRILLDSLKPAAYVPMDISFDHLREAATGLSNEYPWLPVHATCVDFTHSLPVPGIVPDGPRLFFFPGSSIGNFERDDAGRFLRMIHTAAGDNGMLLIGVDTKKNESILNAAYNDQAGITAEFNLNLLHRMRNEIGVDCDPDRFAHKAFYNEDEGRIEMYLVSNETQTLKLNGHEFELKKGEEVHTENSYKYSPEEFINLSESCGFNLVRQWIDTKRLFATYLLST